MTTLPPEINVIGSERPDRPAKPQMTVLEAMLWAIERQKRLRALYTPPDVCSGGGG